MFSKFFNRGKAANPAPAIPAAPEPMPPVSVAVAPKESRLEAFREEWEDKWEASHDVIEGQGGLTDWAAWTDAVENEEKFFAPTVPMPLDAKPELEKEEKYFPPTVPMPLDPKHRVEKEEKFFAPTVPMPLDPK